ASRVPFAWIVESTRRAFAFRGAHAASVYVSAACREPGIAGLETHLETCCRQGCRQLQASSLCSSETCSAALVFFNTATIKTHEEENACCPSPASRRAARVSRTRDPRAGARVGPR